MDKYILESEKYSLGTDQIRGITQGKCNILSYEHLEDYTHIDEVLGENNACIILYQTKARFGHWVALIKNEQDVLTFFDSYGLQVDEELEFSMYNLKIHGNRATPHLSYLINESGYKLIQNQFKLQSNISDVNTCGRWAGLFVRFRNMGLKKFQSLFIGQSQDPDYYVSALTLLF